MVDSSYFNYSSADIIKYPLITDKATRLLENNQYSFIVNPSSDKITIKAAIEYLFNVKVIKVNTCHLTKNKIRLEATKKGNQPIVSTLHIGTLYQYQYYSK